MARTFNPLSYTDSNDPGCISTLFVGANEDQVSRLVQGVERLYTRIELNRLNAAETRAAYYEGAARLAAIRGRKFAEAHVAEFTPIPAFRVCPAFYAVFGSRK